MTNPYLLQIAQKLARNTQGNQDIGPVVYGRKIDDVVKGETYAVALQNLREKLQGKNNSVQHMFSGDDGNTLARPLTCKESFEALVEHYKTGSDQEQKLHFWRNGFDTCAGVIAAATTEGSKIKIIPLSRELVNISQSFTGKHINVDYSKIEAEELPFRESYGKPLTKENLLNNLYWLALFEGNKALLKEVADIVFSETRKTETMEFWFGAYVFEANVLKTVYINGINNDMRAVAHSPLDVTCRFLTLKTE